MSGRPALRAPAHDGEVLAVPPLAEAGRLIESNRRVLAGRGWDELRGEARRDLLTAARGYLFAHGEPLPAGGGDVILVAGHQPELSHPGVWAKHFALAGLARRHAAVAVNLLIDHDTVKSTAVRVPLPPEGPDDWPSLGAVPFDRWQGETPWEERGVLDAALFARFGAEMAAALRPWGIEPLAATVWPAVCRAVATRPVGEAFAAARRRLERDWGCHNLEVPLSALCEGEAFARFAALLLRDLGRFVVAHNDIVRAYRRRRRVRSRNHPVPDLAVDGDWLEAPFWGWRRGQRRGRLFVRLLPDRFALRGGGEPWPDVPTGAGFAAAWRGLAGQGYKVRPRALTTTLFARLFLADLFVHGIGGGKYDELTDELMRRCFAVEPPEFLVLSATRRLPLPAYAATADDRSRLTRRLRELRYNPQRHLPAAEADRLHAALAERAAWVAQRPDTSAGRRQRFAAIRAANDRLADPLAAELGRTVERLHRLERQLDANALLRRRDFSFCVYPSRVLRPFLAALL